MPVKVFTVLQRAGNSATRVLDEKLSAQRDNVVFAYARSHQMTIITYDTDYLNRTICFQDDYAA